MISWPGRKKKQLPQLLRFVPHNILDDCAICEPFFGTGEFTRALLDTCDRGAVFAAEACRPLYFWWQNMMHNTETMLDCLTVTRNHYSEAGSHRDTFDALRDGFNQARLDDPEGPMTAAMLWVLVYQSTNNLARFNQKGGYNQTWGKGRVVPDPQEVFGKQELYILKLLKDATDRGCFTTDFRLCLQAMQDACPDNVLVYLDPPYILETGTYQTDCWGNQELNTLMDWIQGLETDGHWWMMTDYLANGDQTHPYAEAIKTHYQVYPLERKHNSRPNGTSDAKEEVIIVGGSVGEPYPIDSTTNQAALFQEE